jgi:hypothetical protein
MNVAAWAIRAINLKRLQRAPREVRLFAWEEADRLLRNGMDGWHLAPEEDHNHQIGFVWLERRAPQSSTSSR